MRRILLEIQGPVTADLFELGKPVSSENIEVFIGSGMTRLAATVDAIKHLNSGMPSNDRRFTSEYASRALTCLRQSVSNPHRVEGDLEEGLSMYAIIHLLEKINE